MQEHKESKDGYEPGQFDPSKEELLRDVGDDKYCLFPLRYPDIYDMYKEQVSAFWVPEELNFVKDKSDIKKMTPDERHFIYSVLAFFANADALVMENVACNFTEEFGNVPEINLAYGAIGMIEGIHNVTYSTMIEQLVADVGERKTLFHAIKTMPAIANKATWVKQWMDAGKATLPERLVAFMATEGIMFSASFCAIFWLKKRGLFDGLVQGNTLIARDEALHCRFGALLYSKLAQKLPQERVHEIFKSCVDTEVEFCTKSLPVALLGINADLMVEYVKYVADYWLQYIGCDVLYGARNPFPWMEMISNEVKGNFFEQVVTEYAVAGVGVDQEKQHVFTLEEDF